MFKVFKTMLAGRELSFEIGKFAGLANGSVLVRYGDTCVMATATASAKPREGIDFFPLSVDYEEKLYAVGKIPGSFQKREGKPTEKAILTSRVIDRPMRPLFPHDLRNDVTIITTVMSVEQDNSPEIAAMIGASAAVCISDIPFNGPLGAVWVALVDGEYIMNPTVEQREKSEMVLTLAGTKEKIVMIEAGANEVKDDVMLNAIKEAHGTIREICDFISSVAAEVGKEKFEYEKHELDHEMYEAVREYTIEKLKVALDTDDKRIRDKAVSAITDEVIAYFGDRFAETANQYGEIIYKIQKEIVRTWLLKDHKRVDGRTLDQIRPLASEVGLLPRVHGSGMFTRGQTQVLTIATLGPLADVQKLDGIDDEETKRYMHQYNFPSYSVGETRPSRGPGRREIGHGALAEKALVPVLPSEEEFPYAMRLVSEVLSSNGSTSQGAICGSTLALMDAGVPIKTPVAGISCGLVTSSEDDSYITMVDIQGLEDFYGDMDFKVGGTKNGITAIQVDIKNDGLTYEIIEKAFEQTRVARMYILDEVMAKAIAAPREELSAYAPKVINIKISVDKIAAVIGQRGKVIQAIVAESGAQIDIEEDGRIFIFAQDQAAGEKARTMIENIVRDPVVGETYMGKVVKLMQFGAFVEFMPGKEGLVHISKLDNKRVEKVEDVVAEGDQIMVKLMEIDKQGRMNLSRKDALADLEKKEN
jgi:polyribonucleotide nucleotidyltransferase